MHSVSLCAESVFLVQCMHSVSPCRHRNANRRQYVPLPGDMGVFEAMELQRQTQKDSEKGILQITEYGIVHLFKSRGKLWVITIQECSLLVCVVGLGCVLFKNSRKKMQRTKHVLKIKCFITACTLEW